LAKVIYDGLEIEVSEPRLWPMEFINFRCNPTPRWNRVAQFYEYPQLATPIIVCRSCFRLIDGWHRLAAAWQRGERYIYVQFSNIHLGAQGSCYPDRVNWVDTLRPWADLECVSGSYHRKDVLVPCFGALVKSLKAAGDKMPTTRLWEHAKTIAYLGVVVQKNILDVGARESIVPSYLADKGAHVTAVDLSTKNTPVHKNVTVRDADARDLPFENDSFDAVISTACVKLIDDDSQAMREMVRVLKPHGLLAVSSDFGREYLEFPSSVTGRRVYTKEAIYDRLIKPVSDDARLIGPVDFDRSDWNDWPIKDQAPAVYAKGFNVQVAFILMRKDK